MQSILSLDSKISRNIRYRGKDLLFFSGTSYLGMGGIRAFEDSLMEGIRRYGMSHGLSRANNVRLNVYEDFESFFAKNAGAEDAIVWSSGFLAGTTVVECLRHEHAHTWVAPGTHPAVVPSGNPSASPKDWTRWKEACMEMASTIPATTILLISNSVNVLHPKVYDFDWIRDLPAKHAYTLLIDDSHGFGVLGEGVFGGFSLWKDLPVNVVVSGSLGKGLSLPAGIIVGRKQTLDGIRNTAIYRGASPPPPAYLDAFIRSIRLFDSQREKLLENMSLAQAVTDGFSKLDHDRRFPVFGFEAIEWVAKLEENGIVVSSFPYPNPNDPCINRIVLSAAHEKEDLMQLGELLKKMTSARQ